MNTSNVSLITGLINRNIETINRAILLVNGSTQKSSDIGIVTLAT